MMNESFMSNGEEELPLSRSYAFYLSG